MPDTLTRPVTYLFVGERPSRRAVALGATWQNGRLAAKTLHAALRACGLDPAAQHFVNLYRAPVPSRQDCADEGAALAVIHRHLAAGMVVVGLGQPVCSRL